MGFFVNLRMGPLYYEDIEVPIMRGVVYGGVVCGREQAGAPESLSRRKPPNTCRDNLQEKYCIILEEFC